MQTILITKLPKCLYKVKKTIAEGATALHTVKDQFYGDRSGYLQDPFGHLWFIATHKKDLSPDELRKAGEAFFEEMSEAKAA